MINLKKYISSKLLFFLLVACTFSIGTATAQKKGSYIEGSVKDNYGRTLSGATISAFDNSISVISGEDGVFSLSANILKNEVFFVSLNGYKTKKIIFRDKNDLQVVLQTDVSGRDNTISLLTGDREMSSVGASAVTITSDDLDKTKSTSLGSALIGRLPGYFGGLIRGYSTTNTNSPIILVDGMLTNSFGYLHKNDVESVTILKDASAVALYGFEGANGIISVKTKKGFVGKSKIIVDANYTMRKSITKPTVLSSAQHARLFKEAWENDGNLDPCKYSDLDIANYESGENRELYPNNNWYDMFINDLLQTEDVHVSGQGGTQYFKYYVGMGYLHQNSPYKTDGTVPETYGTHQVDVKSNLDVKINDYISGYMNVSARFNRSYAPQDTKIMSTIFNLDPTVYGPLTPDGHVVITETEGNSTYGKINRGGYKKTTGAHISSIAGINFNLKKILPGLTFGGEMKYYTVPISYINGNTNYERWVRDNTIKDSLVFYRFGSTRNEPVTFSKSKSTSYRTEYQFNLKYKNTFGNHGVGASSFMQKQYYNSLAADGVQPFIKMTFGFTSSYSYKDLIYTDFVASYQGSEQFSSDNRYGFFPSLSTALVLSNFDFLKNNSTITFLKLHGSYGAVGNDRMTSINNRFLYKDNLSIKGSKIVENRIGNPDLTWETSKIANIGVNIGLWDQLSLSFEYFNDKRDDILVQNHVIPSMLGIASGVLPLMNDGEVHNHGFEAQMSYQKEFSKDFGFDFTGYMAYSKNKIINNAELYLGDDYAYPYRKTGYCINQRWGYKIDYSNGNGYFNSSDEIIDSGLSYKGAAPRPGDFKYQDLNGDNVIDEKDMAPIGYSNIPRMNYAFEFNIRWKNFELSSLFIGTSKVGSFNSGCGFYESYNQGTFFSQHLNAWTPERYANGENITAPALSLTTSASQKPNDYYYQDRSYFRLQELTFTYNLPSNIYGKFWSKGAKIYFSGRNLLTFDNMKSDDLTVSMGSVNSSPDRRVFVFGLNLTF